MDPLTIRNLGARTDSESARLSGVIATLGSVLPPALVSLFDKSFVRSCVLYDEFTSRLALQVGRGAGLFEAAREAGTSAEIVARAQLEPERALVPVDWLLRELVVRGAMERVTDEGTAPPGPMQEGAQAPAGGAARVAGVDTPAGHTQAHSAAGAPARYRAVLPFPDLDPEEPLEAQRRHDPSWLASYLVAQTAARDYPAFLKGTLTGEEILFSPQRLSLWFDYFSNDNGQYVVNNRVGALAAQQWLAPGGGPILELGGGLGSAALALLEAFREAGRLGALGSYRFTELVPAFLRRGQRALAARFPESAHPGLLSFGRLDMDKPFADQGVAAGSAGMVYAVNTLHVARDLAFTLAEIRRALRPGGVLVLSECVRPFPGQPIYVELIFNLMEAFRAPRLDPRYRPNGGFLTPEQWSVALETAGFRDVRFLPDMEKIREHFSVFYVAAIGATSPG